MVRALVLAAVLLVSGCSAVSGGDSVSADAPAAADEEAAEGGGTADGTTGDGSLSVGDTDDTHQFVTTGSVTLEVEDPAEAAERAAELVEAVGGHVQERVESAGSGDDTGSAYLVVRIPSTEVTGTLKGLKDLGHVLDTSLTSTEVTAQARDLDARIRALQTSVGRLEDLLSRSGTIADIVEAERILTDRQSELEALQSQRTTLAEQVEMSTVRLELVAEGTPPEITSAPRGFWAGLVAGWQSLIATLNGLLQLLGVLLPWLVFGALVTVGVVAAGRALRRRKASTALPSAPQPQPVAAGAVAAPPGWTGADGPPPPGPPPGPGQPPREG